MTFIGQVIVVISIMLYLWPTCGCSKYGQSNPQRSNPRPSGYGDRHLPNPETGPGRPLPDYVNFYEVYPAHPDYLLCTYRIREKNYSHASDAALLKDSLDKVRSLGRTEFPSKAKWIAVIVYNSAEHHNESDFGECHKVGAVFNLAEVCDEKHRLSQLIEEVKKDRHPFSYEPERSKVPYEQQRWLMVERHAVEHKSGNEKGQ